MAKSKTDVKRAQQKKDAKDGIVRDTLVLQKAARAKADLLCSICKSSFKQTEKMVEGRQHAESKHPKSTFEICFPMLFEEEGGASA